MAVQYDLSGTFQDLKHEWKEAGRCRQCGGGMQVLAGVKRCEDCGLASDAEMVKEVVEEAATPTPRVIGWAEKAGLVKPPEPRQPAPVLVVKEPQKPIPWAVKAEQERQAKAREATSAEPEKPFAVVAGVTTTTIDNYAQQTPVAVPCAPSPEPTPEPEPTPTPKRGKR
jgi:hypothetical protein